MLVAQRVITGQDQWTNPLDFNTGVYPSDDVKFNISVGNGPFVATVTLQRSFDGVTFEDVWTTTAPAQKIGLAPEPGVVWRIGCKTGEYTSGSPSVRISR